MGQGVEESQLSQQTSAGPQLPGPFAVGRYARKLQEEMRKRARVQLIGEVTGVSRSKVQAYFELRDGEVYIDGEKLDEPYLPDGTRTDPADPSRDTFVVPEDEVFVMGDNRSASRDARYWQHPSVPEEDIVGKAFIRIWPLNAFGGI